ncbi:MarR family winged helix-turn-helix transcriptional regulator [Umezawaea sp. NPDC059074]|uniref:MarR family winged helix-turn-helix transcriptional regulator n=1 Tax=Umezawaea sp. NPDC059074 TaxID=3346716 RepID=UPI00367C74F5
MAQKRGEIQLDQSSVFAIGLLLRRAHTRAVQAFGAKLAPLGIELKHFAVMGVLVADEPLSQRQIGERVDSDKVSVVRILDDLEAKGLALRTSSETDRRVKTIELTPEGRKVYRAAHRASRGVEATLLEDLRPADRDRFMVMLRRFAHPE